MANDRVPSLDGARAISIALVLVSHLSIGSRVPGLWRLDTGNLGVRVFFVISGFIITTLFLSESQRTGSISLPAFYRRRVFRIVPAFYGYVTVVLLLPALTHTSPLTHWWPAPTFTADYFGEPLVVGHSWSLSVEEQFYLIWPSVLVLLGLRRSFIGCIIILLVAPTFRALSVFGIWPTNPRYAFECVSDGLAVGCLMAILRDRLWQNSIYQKIVGTPLGLVPLVLALALNGALENQGLLYYTIGVSALNIGIAFALDRYIRAPRSILGRFLNARPVIWLGLLSYSIYLWQQLFAWTDLSTPVKLLCILGCATISYYAIERPFQNLRRWIEHRGVLSSLIRESPTSG
jgi:peptidoglycan/LPS O-acetylase OafA/YrhL